MGDKYVMEEMLRRGLSLGGEQSGHVIFADYLFTGDGLATALSVLRVMAASGRTLADLASEMTAYPQVLMNLRVKEKVDLSTVPEVAAVLQSVESRLEGSGRLLVRYSGTEPLLRVMLEGQDQARDPPLGPGDHRRGQAACRSGVTAWLRLSLEPSKSEPAMAPRSSPSTSTRSRRFATRAAAACRRCCRRWTCA